MYVVIPAYQPDEKLIGVIEGLLGEDCLFVVVDDGSGEEYAHIFDRIEKDFGSRAVVLHHAENHGKGRAMKTAFEYILRTADHEDGVITVDADGQHLPKDAKKVIAAWKQTPDRLVLGSRHFTGKVPFTSWWGGGFTRIVFSVTTGVRVWDTQTGLRAFSTSRLPEMVNIKGERYDYEIAQLLYAAKQCIDIREVPINVVYINGNSSSHYRFFRDSLLNNRTLLFFILMSLVSFLIDYVVVLISTAVMTSLPAAVKAEGEIWLIPFLGRMTDVHLIALVLGRVLGSVCNFLLNRKIVFGVGGKWAAVKFFALKIVLLAANYGLIYLITSGENALPLWIAQLIVQSVLYPINFVLQRIFVFKKEGIKSAE